MCTYETPQDALEVMLELHALLCSQLPEPGPRLDGGQLYLMSGEKLQAQQPTVGVVVEGDTAAEYAIVHPDRTCRDDAAAALKPALDTASRGKRQLKGFVCEAAHVHPGEPLRPTPNEPVDTDPLRPLLDSSACSAADPAFRRCRALCLPYMRIAIDLVLQLV